MKTLNVLNILQSKVGQNAAEKENFLSNLVLTGKSCITPIRPISIAKEMLSKKKSLITALSALAQNNVQLGYHLKTA